LAERVRFELTRDLRPCRFSSFAGLIQTNLRAHKHHDGGRAVNALAGDVQRETLLSCTPAPWIARGNVEAELRHECRFAGAVD